MLLVAHLVAAHPHLLSARLCGEAAHPTRREAAHDAPIEDADISFHLVRATAANTRFYGDGAQPTTSELVTQHASLALSDGAYLQGARHLLRLSCGRQRTCQALVTASHGYFEDRGWHNDGRTGGPGTYASAVHCDGRRASNAAKGVSDQLFVWRAPSDAAVVRFDATVSTGEYSRFLRALPLVANATLPEWFGEVAPDDGGGADAGHAARPSGTTSGDGRLDLKWHGWLGGLAFAVFFPLAAASARYRVDAQRKARAGGYFAYACTWLNLHMALNTLGCMLACGCLGVIEAHKMLGGHPHLMSAHSQWGLAAIAISIAQPITGVFRPAASHGRVRTAWRVGHVCTGYGLILAGLVATALGIDKGKTHSGLVADGVAAAFYGWLAVGGGLVACAEGRRLCTQCRPGKDISEVALTTPPDGQVVNGTAELFSPQPGPEPDVPQSPQSDPSDVKLSGRSVW